MTVISTPPTTPTITNSTPNPNSAGAFRKHRGLLLMLLPCVLFFLVFHYIPMGGVIIAFKDFYMRLGILGSPWNGVDNFVRLFSGAGFLLALRNTIIISLLRLTFGFIAPIMLALLLNELRIGIFKRGIQTLTYLPFFLSWVILGGMFLMFFSSAGPVNQVLTGVFGLHKAVPFLTDGTWFVFILIITGIWQGAGYGAVIYLAALAGINIELYEAAIIDGASRWQQVWHITLPGLSPTIVVLFILSLGGILSAGFDQIYNLSNPSVLKSSDIIDTYMLRRLTTMDFSLATAAGVFKSAVGLFFIVLVNNIARRVTNGEQGVW